MAQFVPEPPLVNDTMIDQAPPTTPLEASASVVGGRDADSSSHIKSLAKGLRALDLLLERDDIGTVEVAAALGIDKGAASRLMRTLVQGGYAIQGAGRRYQAGAKLQGRSRIAHDERGSIRDRARPLLQRLHDVTLETCTLAVRADDQVLCLDRVASDLPLRVDRPVGTLWPLHCTAVGKIFLAYGEAPVPRTLPSFTQHTPTDLQRLRASLNEVVQNGYAVDDEEFAPGIRCVAAPLKDRSRNVVAAIGMSAPAARVSAARMNEYGRVARSIAADFS